MLRPLPHQPFEYFLPSYRLAGGVLDYFVYRVADCSTSSEEAQHREVALAAVQLMTDAANINRVRVAGEKADVLRCFPERATSHSVSWAEFSDGGDYPPPRGAGYRDLFLKPPYGLQVSDDDAKLLFEKSLRAMIPSISHPIRILAWSVDWADYFQPGLEWWGAALWTITTDYGATITAIVASSTD
jgi:hypothetical protein